MTLDQKQFNQRVEQDYYNHVQPEDSIAKGVIPEARVAGSELEYIEVKMPDGSIRLCILTTVPVANGPGAKYQLSKVST